MSNLDEMQTYIQVIETGSFTAAAQALGQSKSSVSKHIASLEERLGARLLNRTTRKMSSTEVGHTFYERCLRVISELEAAERCVTDLQETPRGTLRINTPHSFGNRHVAPVIAQFMKVYPDLSVDLNLNDRVVDVVAEGYDLVIRISNLPDSSLIAKKLAPLNRIICASPDYWDQYGRPEKPEDLQNHDCLLYAYLSTGKEWKFQGPDGISSVNINGRFIANDGDALLAAAKSGLGVLGIPSFIAHEDICAGKLETVLTDYTNPEASIYAVYPHSRHLSVKVRLFIDFLMEKIGPTPIWDQKL